VRSPAFQRFSDELIANRLRRTFSFVANQPRSTFCYTAGKEAYKCRRLETGRDGRVFSRMQNHEASVRETQHEKAHRTPTRTAPRHRLHPYRRSGVHTRSPNYCCAGSAAAGQRAWRHPEHRQYRSTGTRCTPELHIGRRDHRTRGRYRLVLCADQPSAHHRRPALGRPERSRGTAYRFDRGTAWRLDQPRHPQSRRHQRAAQSRARHVVDPRARTCSGLDL
jgi:hypothetical protein